MTLLVVMVSWVYTSLQTHQVVCIKYEQLLMCQPYLNKVIQKKKTATVVKQYTLPQLGSTTQS